MKRGFNRAFLGAAMIAVGLVILSYLGWVGTQPEGFVSTKSYFVKAPVTSFTIPASDLQGTVNNISFSTWSDRTRTYNPLPATSAARVIDNGGTTIQFQSSGGKILRKPTATSVLSTQLKFPQPVSALGGDIQLRNLSTGNLGTLSAVGDSSKNGANVRIDVELA